jgi:hypothetical protein
MSEVSPGSHDGANPCVRAADLAARTEAVSQAQALPQVIMVPAGGRQTVLWVIALLLAIIATALVSRWDAGFSRSAMAQYAPAGGQPAAGARGIYAFTGQLGLKNYGLFMMDVDSGTVWCYELARGRDNELQLQLVAARSWIFDRFLEEFNVARPTPNEVQMMVRQQRGNAATGADLLTPPAGSPTSPSASAPAEPSGPTAAPLLPNDDGQK